MSDDSKSKDFTEKDPLAVFDVARMQFERALRVFSAWVDDVERQTLAAGPEENDGGKRMKAVTAAMQSMLDENGRFHGTLERRGPGTGSVIDLDAARAEIARRLDRLRRTGDEVSGRDG